MPIEIKYGGDPAVVGLAGYATGENRNHAGDMIRWQQMDYRQRVENEKLKLQQQDLQDRADSRQARQEDRDWELVKPTETDVNNTLKTLNGSQYMPEGQRMVSKLQGDLSAIRQQRFSLRPQQYDSLLRNWQDRVNNSGLDAYKAQPPNAGQIWDQNTIVRNGHVFHVNPQGRNGQTEIKDLGTVDPNAITPEKYQKRYDAARKQIVQERQDAANQSADQAATPPAMPTKDEVVERMRQIEQDAQTYSGKPPAQQTASQSGRLLPYNNQMFQTPTFNGESAEQTPLRNAPPEVQSGIVGGATQRVPAAMTQYGTPTVQPAPQLQPANPDAYNSAVQKVQNAQSYADAQNAYFSSASQPQAPMTPANTAPAGEQQLEMATLARQMENDSDYAVVRDGKIYMIPKQGQDGGAMTREQAEQYADKHGVTNPAITDVHDGAYTPDQARVAIQQRAKGSPNPSAIDRSNAIAQQKVDAAKTQESAMRNQATQQYNKIQLAIQAARNGDNNARTALERRGIRWQ